MEDTKRRLEFEKILHMLAAEACCYGGRELAAQLAPSASLDEVERSLAETDETLELLRFNEPNFLNDLPDIKAHLVKAHGGGMLYPQDLMQVLQVVRACRMALAFLAPGEGARVRELAGKLREFPELEKMLRAAIDENGEIRDDASPELRDIRNRIAVLKVRIRDYLRDFIKSPANQKYLQDGLITERGGRYVIPVKQEYRHEIKGIVHDESSSGATVFIEPEMVVRSNNEIRHLEMEEKREIERILRRLTAVVGQFAEILFDSVAALETLDFWVAKARLALRLKAYRPRLNDRGRIRLLGARHPLLGRDAVPIDVELGYSFNILVITGPNTGGKTVSLKTVGLLTLMAMSGLFIPAQPDSELSVFTDVLADIGDEQSIEQSLSTFSSHMTNIINILERAGTNSLVILDELGAGTDPLEGAALGRAILERLLEKGARVLVSTHHSELKAFAYQHEGVENASVEFDPVSLRPTYRLTIGLPGQSNAFEIARRLGMPAELVEKARQFVPQQEVETARMLHELKNMRYQAEQDMNSARQLRVQLEQERRDLEEKRRAMEQEHRTAMQRLKQDAYRYLKEVQEEAEQILNELKEKAREAEAPRWHEIGSLRHQVQEKLAHLQPDIQVEQTEDIGVGEGQLGPGSYVEIKSIGQYGYVLEGPFPSGEVTVQVGIMKLTVKKEDLVVRDSPDEKAARKRHQSLITRRKNVSAEIMLLGLPADEALAEVERYLEEAYLAGLERVRIVHGKGTGTLRRVIREHLAGHPYVKSFRDGEAGEGGHGVTITYLKER